MSIVIYPTDDRDYNAEEASGYFATRTSGVFATENNFAISVVGERGLKISNGIAWIKDTEFTGRSVINKGDVSLSLSVADGIYDRIDRVVIRYDKEANDCFFMVLEGTPSSEPIAPDIVRTDFIYDLGIYTILVEKATLNIEESNITSTMLDEKVCGVMRDGVTGLPTAQIQTQTEQLLDDIHSEANELIDDLREIIEQVSGSEIPNASIGTEKFTSDAKTPFSVLADNSKNGAFLISCELDTNDTNDIYKLVNVPNDVDVVDIKFVAPKDFDVDKFLTFRVNDEDFEAYLQNGDGLTNGFFAKDRIVVASVDFTRKAINFKSSGGSLKFAKGKITTRDLTSTVGRIKTLEIPTPFKAQHFRLYTEAGIDVNFIKYNGDFYDKNDPPDEYGARYISDFGDSYFLIDQGSDETTAWEFHPNKTGNLTYFEVDITDSSIMIETAGNVYQQFLPLTTYIFEIWSER